MIYSYTQISHYLGCPRRYRFRYIDGWQEKDTRAGMLFGRAFEQALTAYFLRQDATEVLFREWSAYQNARLEYSHGDTWDRMLQQGTICLSGCFSKPLQVVWKGATTTVSQDSTPISSRVR